MSRFPFAMMALFGPLALSAFAEDTANPTNGKREFPLKYRLAANISQEIYCCGQYLTPTANKVKFTEEPKYLSKEPLYASVKLGVKKDVFNIVMDHSGGENRGYDILYVD